MRAKGIAAVAAVSYVALIAASNWLIVRYGLIWGLIPAGTFTAGLVLAARDWVRESAGLAGALGCVALGATLSWFMATPQLALASGIAFAVSELADTAVYEPLRKRGKVRALAWSNAVGSVVDSALFLALAGFPLWPAMIGQVAVKWVMCVGLPLAAWAAWRMVRRPALAD